MADVQFNVDQALAKLGELVTKHGPQAVDVAAQVVQVNAVGQIAQGAVMAVLAAVSAVAALRLVVPVKKAWSYEPGYDNATLAVGGLLGVVLLTCGVLIAGLCAALALTDAWAWVALFNPKLALAHTILAKIGL